MLVSVPEETAAPLSSHRWPQTHPKLLSFVGLVTTDGSYGHDPGKRHSICSIAVVVLAAGFVHSSGQAGQAP